MRYRAVVWHEGTVKEYEWTAENYAAARADIWKWAREDFGNGITIQGPYAHREEGE